MIGGSEVEFRSPRERENTVPCLFVASIFRAGEIILRGIPKFSFVRVNLRRVKIDGFTFRLCVNNAYHFKA
jgi:hypothetical protein